MFADPDHQGGRELLADALEQLGYQSETGPWRNFYLTGAKELRDGVMQLPTPNTASPDSVRAMTLDTFLDYLGIRLNGPKAAGKTITLNIDVTDTDETAVLFVANGVPQPLHRTPRRRGERRPVARLVPHSTTSSSAPSPCPTRSPPAPSS